VLTQADIGLPLTDIDLTIGQQPSDSAHLISDFILCAFLSRGWQLTKRVYQLPKNKQIQDIFLRQR
jgi:hypothetical protein